MSRAAPKSTLEVEWRREVIFVLGCCIVDLQRAVLARSMGLTEAYLPANLRAFWTEMCRQADLGRQDLDGIAMRNWLADSSGRDADATRTLLRDYAVEGYGRYMPSHLVRLREAWLKIRLAEVTKAQVAALEVDEEADYAHGLTTAEEVRAELQRLKTPPRVWRDVVKDALARASEPSTRVVRSTGFQMLDNHLGGGWRPGWLVVVMGRAKSGKSALAVGFACENALRGRQTLVVSLEMGEDEQAERILARESGVPLRAQHNGDLTGRQRYEMGEAGARVSAWPIEVVCGLRNVDAICDRARVHARERGLDMLVVDYLQLISNGGDNRVIDLEHTTRSLKLLAVEMQCVVILLSQPHNAAARAGDVGLFDGKGSGSIAADCDAMLVPLRDDKDPCRAGLDLVGCRHAEPRQWPVGTLRFDGGRTMFVDPAYRPAVVAQPTQQGIALEVPAVPTASQRTGENTL